MHQAESKGLFERFAQLSEKLHFAIGGVALSGFIAESLTGINLVSEAFLLKAGALAIGLGFVAKGVAGWIGGNKAHHSTPAPA